MYVSTAPLPPMPSCPEGRIGLRVAGPRDPVAAALGNGARLMGTASPGAAAPQLPKRKRKSLGAPSVERPRLLAGTAGLARLGHSLVARSVHSSYTIGLILEWCQP